MLTVFIVEDEQLIREGMLKLVEWRQLGFEVVGEAGDGELAWPLIQDLRPDIVITDIRMPFMDGLSLSRLIKQHLPAAKIIILSGYDDFEYAQKALNIGVDHYVLKPVTKAQLTELLVKTRVEKLESVAHEQSMVQLHQEAFRQKKRVFFEELMTGSREVLALLEQAGQLGLDVVKDEYKLLMIMILPKEPGVLAGVAWNIIERIRTEMSASLAEDPNVFEHKSSPELTVFLLAANQGFQESAYQAELKLLNFFEQEYDDLVFLIATTNSFQRLSEVSEYYHLGRNRLLEQWWKIRTQQIRYSFNPPRINSVLKIEKTGTVAGLDASEGTVESGGLIDSGTGTASDIGQGGVGRAAGVGTEFSSDFGAEPSAVADASAGVSAGPDAEAAALDFLSFARIPDEWTDSQVLVQFFMVGSEAEIPGFVEQVLSGVSETQWQSQTFVQYMFLSASLSVQGFIQSLETELDEGLEQLLILPASFENQPSRAHLGAYLETLMEAGLYARQQKAKSRYYDVIQDATAYIYQHFGEVDLRLSDIASHVNMSPAYFTTVFSQETGKTLTEFITEVRMGEARILLRTSNQTHFEIALTVGYRDVSYFSRLFKKYHNISPGKYRKGVV